MRVRDRDSEGSGSRRNKVLTSSDLLEGAFVEDGGGDSNDRDRDRDRSDDESGEAAPRRRRPSGGKRKSMSQAAAAPSSPSSSITGMFCTLLCLFFLQSTIISKFTYLISPSISLPSLFHFYLSSPTTSYRYSSLLFFVGHKAASCSLT